MSYPNSVLLGATLTSTSASTRFSLLKLNFLEQLLDDLRRVGFRTCLQRSGATLQVGIYAAHPPDSKLSAVTEFQSKFSVEDHNFLASALAQGISQSFTSGKQVKVSKIIPTLEFCRIQPQFAIFRFCRLLQSVAAPRLLYRQLAIIIRDAGQESRPVIGIAGLTSPVYSLQCRDRLFGWSKAPDALRNLGLKRCMQLGVCMAVPPYNQLRGAKLVAALAASREVADEYQTRYGAPLLAIVTTSARGLHTPIFNRIMLKPGGLYRRIGATTGYSALAFSKGTIATAKRLVVAHDGICPATTDRPIRVLKRAMNLCGIPRERFMRLGVRKGVYAAWPDGVALQGLTEMQCTSSPKWPTVKEVVAYWKDHELTPALKRRSHIARFRSTGWADVLGSLSGI